MGLKIKFQIDVILDSVGFVVVIISETSSMLLLLMEEDAEEKADSGIHHT